MNASEVRNRVSRIVNRLSSYHAVAKAIASDVRLAGPLLIEALTDGSDRADVFIWELAHSSSSFDAADSEKDRVEFSMMVDETFNRAAQTAVAEWIDYHYRLPTQLRDGSHFDQWGVGDECVTKALKELADPYEFAPRPDPEFVK